MLLRLRACGLCGTDLFKLANDTAPSGMVLGHELTGTVEALGAFLVGQGLAKFKSPERVETVESYPVTRVGKVDRQVLRTQIAEILAGT